MKSGIKPLRSWLIVESLETRRLLSAAIVNGVLKIDGTSGDNDISVSSENGTTRVSIDGDLSTFNDADYSSLSIHGSADDDHVFVDQSITKQALIFGEDGNDSLTGAGAGDDNAIDGGNGNDTLDYSLRTDNLTAGGGTIKTATGIDAYANCETLLCGSGDDQISIFTFSDSNGPNDPIHYVDGGAGNDNLSYFDGATSLTGVDPTVHGGAGNDTLSVDRAGDDSGDMPQSGGPAYYFGDAGNDTFVMFRSLANRNFNGGSGIDSVDYSSFSSAGGLKVTLDNRPGDGPNGFDNVHNDVEIVSGSMWDDTLIGSNHDETLIGGPGNDSLLGQGGDDLLDGGSEDDTLIGGPGNDTLLGGDGDDSITGNGGQDSLDGGAGHNVADEPSQPNEVKLHSFFSVKAGVLRINGSNENDQITVQLDANNASTLELSMNDQNGSVPLSGIGSLIVQGGAGDDRISINSSITLSTRLYGGAGNDTIFGGSGGDRVYGGAGNDWIGTAAGNDILYGEAGNDRLFGGDGKDYIDGGAGQNLVRGDAGPNRIIVSTLDNFRRTARDLISLIRV